MMKIFIGIFLFIALVVTGGLILKSAREDKF